jgi:hypothetical protein
MKEVEAGMSVKGLICIHRMSGNVYDWNVTYGAVWPSAPASADVHFFIACPE